MRSNNNIPKTFFAQPSAPDLSQQDRCDEGADLPPAYEDVATHLGNATQPPYHHSTPTAPHMFPASQASGSRHSPPGPPVPIVFGPRVVPSAAPASAPLRLSVSSTPSSSLSSLATRVQKSPSAGMDPIDVVRQKWKISDLFARKLPLLRAMDISIIVDDSGSMGDPIEDEYTRANRIYDRTRWKEASATCLTIAEMLLTLRPERELVVYFMNRMSVTLGPVARSGHREGETKSEEDEKARKIKDDMEKLSIAFVPEPSGYTPLAATYERLVSERKERAKTAETRWFALVITDGEPTTGNKVDREGFCSCLRRLREPASRYPVTFALCTSDTKTVDFFNRVDNEFDYVDVVDDYYSERKQILQVQGPDFAFSQGDYLIKLLLGSTDRELDSLDERPIGSPDNFYSFSSAFSSRPSENQACTIC